jgi:hypothetical protein
MRLRSDPPGQIRVDQDRVEMMRGRPGVAWVTIETVWVPAVILRWNTTTRFVFDAADVLRSSARAADPDAAAPRPGPIAMTSAPDRRARTFA